MKMVVGLGNPGNRYDGTRHNVGFEVIDHLLDEHQIKMTDQKFTADYTIWRLGNEKILLVKPFTYMNNSGEAVLPLMSYYGIALEDLLVIYDDLDLEPGKIRLREKGSAGGHNGMKSIIQLLGSSEINRIRLGIGRPQGGWKVVDHVLAPFDKESRLFVDKAIPLAIQAIEKWAQGSSFVKVMNQYN